MSAVFGMAGVGFFLFNTAMQLDTLVDDKDANRVFHFTFELLYGR